MNSTAPSSSAPPPIRLRRVAEIVVVLIIIGLIIGFVPRWLAHRKLLAETKTDSILTVNVISPRHPNLILAHRCLPTFRLLCKPQFTRAQAVI
jgi:hypothetical protein